MKRFIIISLMAITVLPMMGCIWIDNHNSYLFRVCNDRSSASVENDHHQQLEGLLGRYQRLLVVRCRGSH